MNTKRGFTLIEILVVIVIISITLGFTLLAFGDFGASRRIRFCAEEFIQVLDLAKQQALLSKSALRITLNATDYNLAQFNPPSSWIPFTKGALKPHIFPDNATVILKKPQSSNKTDSIIIIKPTGALTPFSLIFTNNKNEVIARITAKANGTIKLNEELSK